VASTSISAKSEVFHSDKIAALERDFASSKIELYEHEYNKQLFGSFSVVLGTAHDRLLFSWDGREFFLNTSRSSFGSAGDAPVWRPFRNIRIANGAGVFDEIRAQTREVFAI
jgi:hypothetical protein